MHDGAFGGLAGDLRRARVTALAPDGRPEVEPEGEAPRLARSLLRLGPDAVGREALVAEAEGGELVVLGLIEPLLPAVEADGERLVIEARREVVIRCGQASIRMTADGRVTIRGTQVLSRAEGPNRVQGASVQLN